MSTEVTISIDDNTSVDGTAWSTLKTAAMASNYKTTSAYTNLSKENRDLASALITAQQNMGLAAISSTPYTTGHTHTDATPIDGTTWAAYKTTAMATNYDPTTLSSPSDQTLVVELIQA